MEYKGFVLDPFQEEAYNCLMKEHSVVVSAATGTGKTLIADFIIDWCLSTGFNVIYTAPIKALSNQKYRDFKNAYGEKHVGILTGDVQINHEAELLIMTTEIYRNMLMSHDPSIAAVKYVIFDEVHYVSDIERGTIWEESLIYSPEHVRFLCLSATVPNAREFADWIHYIKGHPVDVVEWCQRAVPLQFNVFDAQMGIQDAKAVLDQIRKAEATVGRGKRGRKKRFNQQERDQPAPNHLNLVRELQKRDWLPALIFSFSRKSCYERANEASACWDFSTPKGREDTKESISRNIPPEVRELESVHDMIRCLYRGVAAHHAGMLPGLKLVVEEMFSLGHIKVLYATETFSLGINMPARTVAFTALRKYDGVTNRYLMSREFFQCAGRAGRRGIDKIGHVVTMLARAKPDYDAYAGMTGNAVEPIESQFTLSYNTVINLIENHPPDEREELLKSSFDYYIRRREKRHMWVTRRYHQFVKVMNDLGYIQNDKATEKGRFASRIYTHELVVTEMFATDLFKRLTDIQMAIFMATVIYEARFDDHFTFDSDKRNFNSIMSVISDNKVISDEINPFAVKRMCLFIRKWCEGASFTEMMHICNHEEGDIIRQLRDVLDLANQIRHATSEQNVKDAMNRIRDMIDRDIVKVTF